jgi:hypothetical protein
VPPGSSKGKGQSVGSRPMMQLDPRPLNRKGKSVKHKGLYQLLCAAMVDSQFCETLLRDPPQAVSEGYLDHTFPLTPEEWRLMANIKARELEDLAGQIQSWVSTNGNGSGRNGDGQDVLARTRRQAELFRG